MPTYATPRALAFAAFLGLGQALASAAEPAKPAAPGAGPTPPAAPAPAKPEPRPIVSHAAPYPAFGKIERLDPALDALIPVDGEMKKLAEGFRWSEGPIWVPAANKGFAAMGEAEGGFLLFSDIPPNRIYRWKEGSGIRLFLHPAGYSGEGDYSKEPGTNGLTLDAQGRLVVCDHGNRAVRRLGADGKTSVALAERFEGKRLNSPNDLCFSRSGNLYFTDPPYGLPGGDKSKLREMDFFGVYRVAADGKLSVVSKTITRPNGIALSPDQKLLYVACSDGAAPHIYAFDVLEDGSTNNQRLFFKLPEGGRKGGYDGMKVDVQGNLWATGPGGVLIVSPQGKHLGTLLTGQPTANCAFGEDGNTLFITANMVLAKLRVNVAGCGY